MRAPTLLLVDGDPHSRRLLEVTLRKAGHQVLLAPDAETVFALEPIPAVDLVIAATELPRQDGFALRRWMLEQPQWAPIPFLFLTREGRVEDRRRGLELGVEEYLTRPIFVKEVVARVGILLQRRQLAAAAAPEVPREGTLEELGLVELLQAMHRLRSTGVVYLERGGVRGRLFLRQGQLLDGRVGPLDGEDAFFRLLRWPDGTYTVDLREVSQRPRIRRELGELLDWGLGQLAECTQLQSQLPAPDPVLQVDLPRLASDLEQIPESVRGVLRLFDGIRTVSQVIEDSPLSDLETLQATVKLVLQQLLTPAAPAEEVAPSSARLDQWLGSLRSEVAVLPSAPRAPMLATEEEPRRGVTPPPPTVDDPLLVALAPAFEGDAAWSDEPRAPVAPVLRTTPLPQPSREPEGSLEVFFPSPPQPGERAVTARLLAGSPVPATLRPAGVEPAPPVGNRPPTTPIPSAAGRSGEGAAEREGLPSAPWPDAAQLALEETRRRAIEEAQQRSAELIRQAQEEVRQAEEERRRAEEEARRAQEEAANLIRLRSEIEETERKARQAAETLLEQARQARQAAEENRALALAERQRAQGEQPAPSTVGVPAPPTDGAQAVTPPRGTVEPLATATTFESLTAVPVPATTGAAAPVAAVPPRSRPIPAPAVPLVSDTTSNTAVTRPDLPLVPPRPESQTNAEEAFFAPLPPQPAGSTSEEDLLGLAPAEKTSSRPMFIALAGLLLLGVAAVGVFWYWHARTPPRPLEVAGTVAPQPPRLDLPPGTTAEQLLDAVKAGTVTPPGPSGVAPAPTTPAAGVRQPPGSAPVPALPVATPPAGGTAVPPALAPLPPPTASAGVPPAAASPATGSATAPAPSPPPPVLANPAPPPVAPPPPRPAPAAVAPAPGPVKVTPPPTRPTPAPRGDAQALLVEAEQLRSAGRNAEAQRKYEAALALQPANAQALTGLGHALYDLGQTEPAARRFREAIKVNPGSAEAYMGLGSCYQDQQRTAEARQAYERFLQLAPRHKYARDVRRVLEQMK